MSPRRTQKAGGGQGDLFAGIDPSQLFPVRRPADACRPLDVSLRIKTALGRALKECPDSANVIAARMSDILGREQSVDMLYAYTAPSKPEHDIPVTRLIAFVRATGATWLYDEIVQDEGLIVMGGREAELAQLGLLRQESQAIQDHIKQIEKKLKIEPIRGTDARRPAGGGSACANSTR
ncbi:MAG: hypothetical protein M9955_17090 [Rhizobiaceae bacterium]|nr:hypothetical protein [Rhizobiaceae bacterium]MCO5083358.1 hypothetical protein [Rhizobiaceae bacterium]